MWRGLLEVIGAQILVTLVLGWRRKFHQNIYLTYQEAVLIEHVYSHVPQQHIPIYLNILMIFDYCTQYIYTYHRFTYYHNLRTRYLYIPIGSMYGIYANIGGTLMVNVTIYIAYMDPMGYIYIVWCFFHNINLSQTHAWPRRPCVRSASGPLIRSRSSGPSKCRWFLSIRTVIRFEKYYV